MATIIGAMTMNMASRIEGQAEPDGVAVSESTFLRTAERRSLVHRRWLPSRALARSRCIDSQSKRRLSWTSSADTCLRGSSVLLNVRNSRK
jgi:class 3 adenylate cyclase